MDLETIQTLFEYNRWANGRVLEAAAKLTPEQFVKDMGNSFPSVRDTLAHILGAQLIWLDRWKGLPTKGLLDAKQFTTLEALRTRWAEVDIVQADFVKSLTAESLDRVVRYNNTKGEAFAYPLQPLLVHVINHSTYHRGQITTLLRQLGAKPVSTDFTVFYARK